VRCVYLVDPNKKIRMNITYPQSAGRNLAEILRVIDSIQLTDNYNVSTPVNWEQGDDVVISPALSDEQAKEKFPDGWKELTLYLRWRNSRRPETGGKTQRRGFNRAFFVGRR